MVAMVGTEIGPNFSYCHLLYHIDRPAQCELRADIILLDYGEEQHTPCNAMYL